MAEKKTSPARLFRAERIAGIVCELVREANFEFAPALAGLLDRAICREKSTVSKQALSAMLTNTRLARKIPLPICQDTGLVEVFLEVGHLVRLRVTPYGSLEDVVSEGVSRATGRYFLRPSAVDPLTRENSGDNTPAIVHLRMVRGSSLTVRVMLKGFGSENMGRIANLPPGSEIGEIADFIVGVIREAGANPCPPLIVGCGIGGTMEKAALLAREVLLEPEKLLRPNPDRELANMENIIRKKANQLGIGPAGLGGETTVLAVRAARFPTHIAGLPVAVNLSCWALRTAGRTIP